jgi:hypothetical protein
LRSEDRTHGERKVRKEKMARGEDRHRRIDEKKGLQMTIKE